MYAKLIFWTLVLLTTSMAKPAAAQFKPNPWVHYRLQQNKNAGTWQLSMWASPIGNAGIASYSIPLTGQVTALDHKSPRAGAAENVDGSLSGSLGFTLFRSADGISDASKKVAGSQDNIAPTPFLIYGYGQTAGNWASVPGSPTPLGSNEGNNWLAKPIIASGTMAVGSTVKIDRASVDLVANLFVSVDSLEVMPAGISPEPASGGMAMMALLAATAIRRRRATP
jgi:MYXO-CTERM domain-containing protein